VAIRRARAEVREHIWRLADKTVPDAGGEVIVDIDGVLVLAHSEKEDAARTWKRRSATIRCSRSSTTAARGPGNQ
jgi:hypothetical protein